MKEFMYGKTKVKVYGGLNTVGGNCIVVESPSTKVMLDQGVNFAQLEKFYGFTIQPESVAELREIGALPPPSAYEDVEAILISHLHLDHLGSLNLPQNIPLYLPSREVVEQLSRTWWFGWKQHLFPPTLSFTGFVNIDECEDIESARVSHSAFPSYAFRIETDDASILYTGDFRLESPCPSLVNTLGSLEKLAEDGVDVLIIEGTNFGRRMNYLAPEQFEVLVRKLLEQYGQNLLFISAHPLDLEVAIKLLELLWEQNYTPVFENPYYAKLLDVQMNIIEYQVGDRPLYFAPLRTSRLRLLDNFETANLAELKDRKTAFFIPLTGIKDMRAVLKLLGEDSSGLLHITVLGEPLSEEWVVEEKKISNWLRLLGMASLRLHLSGHYYPYEFKEILDATKPRKIIPVHTKAPSALVKLFKKYFSL